MLANSIERWWKRLNGHERLRTLAWQHLHSGDFDRFSEYVDLGQKKFPNSHSFEILQVRQHLLVNDRSRAIECLKKIELPPSVSESDMFELAEAYRLVEWKAKAIRLYEQLVPDCSDQLNMLINTRLAGIYLRRKNPDSALQSAVQCIRLRGEVRPSLSIELGRKCSDESADKAITDLGTFEHSELVHDVNRLRFRAFLAATKQRWDEAIQWIGEATKKKSEIHHGPELWDDSQPPLRPQILLIGAMKSGTSALFEQIASHPQFVRPLKKELHFFRNCGWPDEFYFAQFPRVIQNEWNWVTGEATPGYYVHNIAERVKRMLPNAKILFIKRDPTDRAISHLFHNRTNEISEHSNERLVFGKQVVLDLFKLNREELRQALSDVANGNKRVNPYLLLGCYDLLMRRWREAFVSDQLLEIEFDDFKTKPQQTMDQVFDFVGISRQPIGESTSANVGRYQTDIQELDDIKLELRKFYNQVASLEPKGES